MTARSGADPQGEVLLRNPTTRLTIAACLLLALSLLGCGAVGVEVRYPIEVDRTTAAAEPEEEPYDYSGLGGEPEGEREPESEGPVEGDGATAEEQVVEEEGRGPVAVEPVLPMDEGQAPASVAGEKE